MTKTVPLRYALFSMALVICVAHGLPTTLAAQPGAKPTIRDARVGFNRIYKLGCWTPLEIELLGGAEAYTGRVLVTVGDSDGVPTTVSSPTDRPIGVEPGQTTVARMLVRVGQANSTMQVRFVADGEVRSERRFYSGPEASSGVIPGGVPATNRLLLEFGPALGLGELVKPNLEAQETTVTRVAHIDEAKDLPTEWIGYEGIDTVLLTTSEPERYRPLLQSPGRLAALRRWVDFGGKLIVFCGAEAPELLSSDGPLVDFVPGEFEEMLPLRQWQPLEMFSGSEANPRSQRLDLRVPKLTNVRGQILAHAGRKPSDLPLVVRSYLGLGELVFVGLDLDRPPLNDWSGRTSFFRNLFNWNQEQTLQEQTNNQLIGAASEDMVGLVRNALDGKFSGVEVVPFAVVALLVVGYIVLIGPGDYYLVKKIFKRPELTWITFPLFVIGVSAAAYWYANWKKGDQLRVNQIEVVDVVANSKLARGTVWTHFFSPRVDTYDLTLTPSYLGGADLQKVSQLVSWLGLPGYALGGMQASAEQTGVFNTGYAYDPSLESMQQVPVQVWSTKTITGRWTAGVDSTVSANLERTGDGLLTGEIENLTDVQWEDCILLYGRWAYQFGRVAKDTTLNVDQSRQPRTVKTQLTSATAGDETITNTADDGTAPFRLAQSDVTRLLKAMMFFEAINGQLYTAKFNRYQSFLDLSHLLQQNDLAILVARYPGTGSQWFDKAQPLESDEDRHWTYYRFVLPVQVESRQ